MVKSSKTAKLILDGNEFDLPIMSPTAGPDVLDIRKLYGEAGVFTYDPGFTSTASCDSTITFIDGGKGELLHRGYPYRSTGRAFALFGGLFSSFVWQFADTS